MPLSAKQKEAAKIVARARRTYPRATIQRSLPAPTSMAIDRRIQASLNRATEQKYIDTFLEAGSGTFVPITFNTNDLMFCVNCMQQGVGQFNRVGNKIDLKSLVIDLDVQYRYGQDATLVNLIKGNQLRMVVVWDTEAGDGGAISKWNTIFGDIYQDGTSSTTLWSGIAPYEKKRFRLLIDRRLDFVPKMSNTWVLGTGGSPATAPGPVQEEFHQQFYLDLSKKKLQTRFNSTAAPTTIANMSSGALIVGFRALNNETASGMVIRKNCRVRVRYTDT